MWAHLGSLGLHFWSLGGQYFELWGCFCEIVSENGALRITPRFPRVFLMRSLWFPYVLLMFSYLCSYFYEICIIISSLSIEEGEERREKDLFFSFLK